MTKPRPIRYPTFVLMALVLGFVAQGPWAALPLAAPLEPDPLVFFAGEDLSVLTVASRRQETPQRAPAIVRVVTAREILTKGYRTLAEVLRAEAGFVIRPGERGSTPYLRGIREGILFLYDGVPLRSPMTKGIHPLDEDLSLAGIDRVEIYLGPGSVLWGPDAFAGIVNLVPRRTVHGSGTGLRVWAGSENDLGGSWTLEGQRGPLSARLSLNGERYRYWDPKYVKALEVDPQTGTIPATETVEDSYAWEALGTLKIGDGISVTGRLADSRHHYTMNDTKGITWGGEKRSPVSFIKATALKRLGTSDLTLNASYTHVPLEISDADLTRKQEDDIFAVDLVWYRPWGENGGVTLGSGYRYDRTKDAVVRDGFLPDFLKPAYRVFVPQVLQADFDNTLISAYGQVRRRLGPLDLWLGLRWDDADTYRSTTTFSAGAAWPLGPEWRLKASYGSAYRTPYAAQLYSDRSIDPERIETAALELSWTQGTKRHAALSVFHSVLSDHLQEDPYGGLSQASRHAFSGVELSGQWALHPDLDVYGSAAAFAMSDDDVAYRVIKGYFIAPGGARTPIEEAWSSPMDVGPDWSTTLGLRWRPLPDFFVALEGLLTAPWPYAYDKGRSTGSLDGERHLRGSLTWFHAGGKGSTLQLVADNLLDQGGTVPGVYGPAKRPPLRVWLEWRLKF